MELERRMHATLEENELLQHTVDDLRERTLVLEKQCHGKDLQVRTGHAATSCPRSASSHLLHREKSRQTKTLSNLSWKQTFTHVKGMFFTHIGASQRYKWK